MVVSLTPVPREEQACPPFVVTIYGTGEVSVQVGKFKHFRIVVCKKIDLSHKILSEHSRVERLEFGVWVIIYLQLSEPVIDDWRAVSNPLKGLSSS
jgi:hypothetical protein